MDSNLLVSVGQALLRRIRRPQVGAVLFALIAGFDPTARAQPMDMPVFYVQPSFVGAVFGGSLKNGAYGRYAEIDGVSVPVGGTYRDTVGGSVAFGANFLPNQAIEADFTYFDASSRGFPLDKVKFTQTLIAYKFQIPLSSVWFAHVGAAVGSTHESENQVSTLFFGQFMNTAYHTSDNVFTGGVLADVNYRLTRNTGLVVGVQVLGLGKSFLVSSGVAALFSAGFNFRF